MSKKVMVGSICAVLMLITISLTATVNSNAIDVEKKESPLWKIRNRRAINERLKRVIDNIKASFFGETRAFFIPSLSGFLQKDESILGSVVVTVQMYCKACKF